MADVTLGTLRTDLIFRADLQVTEPRRYSDVQLNTILNQSIRRLQGNLITWWREDYFTRRDVFTVTQANPFIIITAHNAKLKTVIWFPPPLGGTGRADGIKLQRLEYENLHRETFAGTPLKWNTSDPPKWMRRYGPGDPNELIIEFNQPTLNDESVVIVNVVEFPELTDDADSLPFEMGWEDWIVLDAMVRIRQRDKQDATDILQERAELAIAIQEQAPAQDQTEVQTVRDRWPTRFDGPRDDRLPFFRR